MTTKAKQVLKCGNIKGAEAEFEAITKACAEKYKDLGVVPSTSVVLRFAILTAFKAITQDTPPTAEN